MSDLSKMLRVGLEKSIQEKVELIEKYRRKLTLEDDPKKENTWDDEIKRLTNLIEREEEELKALDNDNSSSSEQERHNPPVAENKEPAETLRLVRDEQIQQSEIQQILTAIMDALDILGRNQDKLSTELQNAVTKTKSAINSEASLQGKFELTLPVIPTILTYKVELAAKDQVNLNALLEKIGKWWKFRSAQPSLESYCRYFLAKKEYIDEFEKKINQNASNIIFLTKAQGEFGNLAQTATSLAKEMSLMEREVEYPPADLGQISGLANTISGQVVSAANSVAVRENPTSQLTQISKNLYTLKRLVEKLSSWLEQF